MSDFAKRHFIKIAGLHLGTTFLEDNWDKDIIGMQELQNFLVMENVITLFAVIEEIDDNKRMKFFRTFTNQNYEVIICFNKYKPIVPSDDNLLRDIQTTTLSGSPTLALFQSLNVFSPLLQQKDQPNISRQIANLQNDLRTAIFNDRSSSAIIEATEYTSLSVVTALEHEVIYWNSVKPSKRDKLTKAACSTFKDLLSTIAGEFNIIDALSCADVEELLEKSHNVLDDLWKNEPPFPKHRITHIMDVIGSDVQKHFAALLKQFNVWTDDYLQISEMLNQEIALGEKWLVSCKQLTEIFWPSYTPNPWKDDIYQPPELVNSISILKKVLEIRSLHRQLLKLLSNQEQTELQTDEILNKFKDIDASLFGQDTKQSLIKAEKQFGYMIQPAEQRIATKLKNQLTGVNSNIRQLIYEYSRYAELIGRPVLRNELIKERQYLLASIHDYLKSIQSEATSENHAINMRYDIPEVVKDIIQLRQLESKVNEVHKVALKILQDLQGYEDLNRRILEISKDLKRQHHELFDSWCADVLIYIKNNTLKLKESDPVVEFSDDKLMRVTFSPRLIVLISEVRQLGAMGYQIPAAIRETSEHAKKFMKLARILEQIAHFHNTIGDQMIACQKPMMLNSALELSKLVQEQEVVSWGQEKSVERYVNTLKAAVEKLSKENGLLTMYHHQILEKIKELEEVDLIKEYSKWKETSKNVRQILAQVEEKGFRNIQSWKRELDKVLSGVLEKQYVESLDTLHIYLPEIRADLIYRNSKLEYLPDEATLRKTYDLQLKRFLDIPKHFRNISDETNSVVYDIILERNQEALSNVAKRTDELFEQLQAVLTHWQSWLQLETLDTTKLTTWQHWDLHFRASKTFGQEIAKLPCEEERVGCFVIGLSRLRSDLESHNRSYWDQLVQSLKNALAQDVVKLQNYVDHSTNALTKQPVTLDEVGETGAVHADILKEKPEMENLFDEMTKKAQTLSSWSREQVVMVNRLKGAWDRLQNLLDNYQHIMEKQMEIIKTTLKVDGENLNKEIERFNAKWEDANPRLNSGEILGSSLDDLVKHLNNVKNKRNEWTEIGKQKGKLLDDYLKFNLEPPDIPFLKEIEDTLKLEEESWSIFEAFNKEFDEIKSESWIVFRKKTYKLEEFLKSWRERLTKTENSHLESRILHEIHKYEVTAPLLKFLKGEDFTENHWIDVFNLLNMHVKPIDQLALNDFLQVSDNIQAKLNELQGINKRAASEIIIRQALAELEHWDIHTRFALSPHKDSKNKEIPLIKDFKEILNKIGDNQSLLQSLKNSPDYDSSVEKVSMWENKFSDLDHYLTSLAQIQRKWLYLEPIFVSGTLSQEKNRFERIDRDLRHVLGFIERDLRVSALCRYPNLRSLLETTLNQLARCQNNLDEFLKEKRNKFPRFLFLSDDDLLEVVGQSSKEQIIQAHLKKIFSGINSVVLSLNGGEITAICSMQGEKITLSNYVAINRPVEVWMNDLVKEMQNTLKELLVNCQKEKSAPDPLQYPSQILCLSESISFTAKCEQAITSMTLSSLLSKYKTQLEHYGSLDLNKSKGNDGDGENVLELKLKALLLDTIRFVCVIEELVRSNTSKITEWSWQKQLRYYSNSTGEVTVKMANARMDYSYEYLGNAAKLVRTPLTEKCFLTLTQGLHLGMGGNPYGPAGTGKTESVKALGHLLGRQVLVFNCDEGIDVSAMGRILIGLVKTGAWGCFDEFNRLDEATLSAISMLIHAIQISIRTDKKTVRLLDQDIDVNKHCGIFVTLNPAGGGYGGRNNLPDNLKQLFRPVVMTHPDNEEIARSLLQCEGYKCAGVAARKLVEIFDISSKLLSKQQHYDWGLRSIRTVLTGCGRALKSLKSNSDSTVGINEELSLIVQVLKTDVLSKLSFADSNKFISIVEDVFMEVDFKTVTDDLLVSTIEESFNELGLIKNDRQINKCLKLFEQLQQRMGIAIVGPPKSGKTTIRKLIHKTLTKMGRIIKFHEFNPKSLGRAQLLGKLDVDTGQWTDGVITKYSLDVTSENSDIWSWIVCDGDIDPDWVESLNSVLDDNRLLSLPSGWRIQFGSNVNFIFETHNLTNASPATISRMGIVLLSEEDMDLQLVLTSFADKLPDGQKSILGPLVIDYIGKAIDWCVKEGEMILPCSRVGMALTVLSQLKDVYSKSQFAVRLMNILGHQLHEDFKEIFCQQVYDWLGETPPPVIVRSRYNNDRGTVESYYTNPNVIIEDGNRLKIPLIPTSQIELYVDCLNGWLGDSNENILLVGPHGSAKTLILENAVKNRTNLELVTIYCSGSLSPGFVITKMAQYCIHVNTHKGKVLRPKRGNLLLHFKNLHLLKPDKWGTNVLVEFLNQLIVYRGFFDSNVEFIGIENIFIVCSLEATNNLSQRFTSNLRIFNISLPDTEDFSVIIVAYLTSVLKRLSSGFPKAKIVKLTASIISFYDKLRTTFNSLHNKHYLFTPHDVVNLCRGILQYKENNEGNLDDFVIEVIKYEARYIFGDKLVNEDDRTLMIKLLNESFESHWGAITPSAPKINYYYVCVEKTPDCDGSLVKLDEAEWRKAVQNGITLIEREGQLLDLVLNEELLHLTANILKIVSRPGGNVLLIGKSGVGRKSAIKIVTALQSAKLIVPSLDFLNNDLKMAMQYAGIESEDVYLLIEDYILNNENNLNIFNSLISSGEAPGLYQPAELDSIVKGLKEESDRENFDGSLIQYYSERIKRNLHVLICLDADNENLWNIIDNCPALIQNCAIIWKSAWNSNTIKETPSVIIDRSNLRENVQHASSKSFCAVYNITQSPISTPSRYISLIKLYIKIYEEKMTTIEAKQHKLKAGVSKLTEAENMVKELKENAAEKQTKLAEKQAKANSALNMITNTMKNANVHKEEMEHLRSKTEEETIQLNKRKKDIDVELAEVEPLIEQARQAVGNIKTESISEIRSLRAPPEIIRDILEGVLRLMGIQDTSWNSMKTFLAKRGVKEDIKAFDANRIAKENRQAVERLMTMKKDSFDPKSAKRASQAAAPLAAWVSANVKYSHVLDKIRPLEMEQMKLKENLSNAENQLGELSAGLDDVDATVAKLKEQLSIYTKEAAEIEIDLNRAQSTLLAAEGLVKKLGDEYERWQKQLRELSIEIDKLPNNCLLIAAFMTYMPGESEDARNEFLSNCVREIGIETINLETFLSTERERMQWKSEGLASYKLSLENAIMILKNDTVPVLVDPTSSAVNWIKRHLKNRNVESIIQSSPKLRGELELAVRFGKILILEEIDTVSPVLFPILRKEFTTQGERRLINMNGKLIDYHKDFKLILCSRNEHIKLPPEISPLVNSLNFTITRAGLTEQLLSRAISQENPEIENKQKELLKEREEMEEKLDNLQNQLLEDLANSKGNILQDNKLLESLNQTKASSEAIAEALKESDDIRRKLQSEYDVYRDLSVFGNSLYFACNEFAKSNVLYLLSVSAFTDLFLRSLQTFQGLDNNLESQKKQLLHTVYAYMSRGIFQNDRLKFLLYLIFKLYPKFIPENEWNVFIGNLIASGTTRDDVPPWIPKHSIANVKQLQMGLPDFFEALKLQEYTLWKNFMTTDECEKDLPKHLPFTDFQKVLVVQAVRQDRLVSAMSQCALNLTGMVTLNPPVLDLLSFYKETRKDVPILILALSGTDPLTEIREVASALSQEYMEVAMGEGQESKALEALKKCSETGLWLILKNLHLVTYWLTILTQTHRSLQPHDKFRLWLISEPSNNFNFVLAQNSLKIVYETSQGIKNNILHTFASFGKKYVEKLSSNSAKIFFVIACVHALFQERRKYIPQGWSKFYDFSDADLSTSVKLVEDIWLNQGVQIQWRFIYGLIADAVYGGRIENLDDMNIVYSYCKQYFVDDVVSHRWKPFGLNCSLPSSAQFDEYMKMIKEFPAVDRPAFFGLAENINRVWEKQISTKMISEIKNFYLQRKISRAKFDQEAFLKGVLPFLSLWKKLNQGHDFIRVTNEKKSIGGCSVENFLHEEFHNAIAFVQIIHKHFTNLNKTCKGAMKPDETILSIGYSLLNHETPAVWQNIWHGPKDPIQYLKTFITKTANLSKWKDENVRNLLEKPLRVSALFHPEAFIASHKQDFAKANKIAMDELVLQTSWRPKSNSLIVADMLIEGGSFESGVLNQSTPQSETYNNVPNCYLNWIKKGEVLADDNHIDVPLYCTSTREKKLIMLQIPCDRDNKDKWLLKGIALYLEY
ncbi:unnamed protein product [Phyllotreta striolata]|uniref:Cytoplasmic dynein 2 heavy chain 1 n=1 Tax=Phyllotreta striolata TaxID=444603 RepID=A0A9N9TW99_PHYSR|nr:unnamed protein product [Phyllotreta striolata]